MSSIEGGTTVMNNAVDEIATILEREGIPFGDVGAIPLHDLDSLLITELLCVIEDHAGHRIVEEAFPPGETTLADLAAFAEQLQAAVS
jgi:acyl carrier protein